MITYDFFIVQALKVIKKLTEHFPIKRAPLRVRFTAPKSKFASLTEKLEEWNANVISKDESGSQPSVVSAFFQLLLFH
jgi:ribosome maturation protein SDO1